MNDLERKYVAVSIKHTAYKWEYGNPCTLWGWKRTDDDENRCFSGYTEYLEKAEIYAIDDFIEHGYPKESIPNFEASLTPNLIKNYEQYDTVLILAEEYYKYCDFFNIPMSPDKDNAIVKLEHAAKENDLNKIIVDFGFDDKDGLVFALEQYQILVCELSHGNLSKLTYYADDLIKVFREYEERKCVLLPVDTTTRDSFYCSECHHVFNKNEFRYIYNFCPCCGARFTVGT